MSLKEWFLEEKRALPWRENPTPYRVWISEVMLQQTQASVVVGYFERWMQKFPTVHDLAKSSLAEVMKAWEGLGYYSRARYLHEAAVTIVKEFGGEIPSRREDLERLKGFGPYTIGAVLSFAFHQKAAAVDGNVKRVISRLFTIEEGIEEKVEKFLPDEEPWVIMEALIELGAMVCQKRPKCQECPLQDQCLAFQKGVVEHFPVKNRKIKILELKREVAIIMHGSELLIRQEKVGKVMGGLYEFPYLEEGETWDFALKMNFCHELPLVKHSFTRYRATLYPKVWKALEKEGVKGYEWVSWEKIASLPFSSGHRRILKQLQHENLTY
jgi:A/G-specific adenine glycosylase